MQKRSVLGCAPFIMVSALFACAQTPMSHPPGARPTGWQQVQGLGPHSKIRIKGDTKDAICYLHFAEEQELTCSESEAIGSPMLTFSRSEIKSIKLSHWMVGAVDDIMPGPFIYRR